MRRGWWLALLAGCWPWVALAQLAPGPVVSGQVGLRSGDHPDFGRLVFDLPAGTTASATQSGDRVDVQLQPPQRPAAAPRPVRNIAGIALLEDGASILLVPGARLRQARLGDRLLLDVLDAGSAPPPAPRPAPRAAGGRPAGLAIGLLPDARERAAVRPEPEPVAASPPPPPPPPPGPNPLAVAAAASRLPPGLAPLFRPPADPPSASSASPSSAPSSAPGPGLPRGSRSIALPFSAGTGAAAFRRGEAGLVVFDERRPIDLSALRADPQFAGASVSLLTAASVLRLPLQPGEGLRLARVDSGWTVGIVPAGQPAPALRPIRPETADGRMRFGVAQPGQVVAVPDPVGGGVLLVGTQAVPGEAMPVERRVPEFAVLPSWQGVAVLPVADALRLRAVPEGFVLGGEDGSALALSAPDADTLALSDASGLSRRFDFPKVAVEGLLRRAQAATVAAAAAPMQSRSALRLGVAQAMIALGMGVEAQSVLKLAGMEDGRLAADPDAAGLSAIAALLAGRVAEADGLDDPRLSGSDEIALWRAVRAAMREEFSPQAAPVFAATLKLLRSYPAPLRDRLAPLVAETMALGGERAAAAAALAAWQDQPGLELARAMLAEPSDPPAALAIYDRLVQGADRATRARAAGRAAELRLATGMASPAQTADALERVLFAWRGDGRELATRLRIAALRNAAGQPRRALAMLRETLQFWPDQAETIRAALTAGFAHAVADATNLAPLELVALAGENPDLLPAGDAGRALAARLADRLLALDLPARAIPVLETLTVGAAPGTAARAELGSRLAQARLQQGDAPGALAALDQSTMLGAMPAGLLEDRTLAYARAAAAGGQREAAQAALAALGTPAALALRASLLEAGQDWKAAAAALAGLAAGLPAEGPLSEDQAQLLLRLANAAARDGDEALLADLRARQAARMPAGPTAELFRLVTAQPVRGVADLPRAGQEIGVARRVADAAAGLGRTP